MSDSPSSKRLKEDGTPPRKAVAVKHFGDRTLSDVCLVVGNTEFNVHKMILANRSKYFKALFYGNFKEKDQDRIDIVDADPLAFERILDVIYDSKFKDTSFFACGEKTDNTSKVFWNQVGNLWAALDRFDVPHGESEFFRAFNENWCRSDGNYYRCSFCVNFFVFCQVHQFDPKQGPPYSYRAIKEWAEKHFDGVPATMASDVTKKLLMTM